MYNTLTFICRKFTNGYQNWLTKEECIQTFVWHVFIDQHFSSPSTQQPRSLTRFQCWSLEITTTSFINSRDPCPKALESLFTTISCPSNNFPYKQTSKSWLDIQIIRQESSSRVTITLYTVPNPPSPSLLDRWKLFVALASSLKLNSSSS